MTETSKGRIYVLFNEMFLHYKEMYKIGSSSDIKKRINGYTTSYLEQSKILFLSTEVENSIKIEKEIHESLNEYRLKKSREFFSCNLETCLISISKILEKYGYDNTNYTETIFYKNKKDKKKLKKVVKEEMEEKIQEFLSQKPEYKIVDILEQYKEIPKLYHCLQFVQLAGFESLKDTKKVKLDYSKWQEYILENEKDIQKIFKCQYLDINRDLDSRMKSSIGPYVQAKLKSILGITIKATSKKYIYYTIETC